MGKATLAVTFLTGINGLANDNPAFAATATTTTLNVASASAPVTSVVLGSPVTLTATVAAGSTAVAPGTVTFCDATISTACSGLAILGTAQLTASGTATLSLGLGLGAHSLQAVFAGTGAYAGSASTLMSLTVTGKYDSETTLVVTPGNTPGVFDLDAVISGSAPSTAAAPTGTVSFMNTGASNAQLGTASLSTVNESSALNFAYSSAPAIKGLLPSSAATGDFNGDGKLDMAVADATNNIVAVFLGNGDGTFQSGTTYPVGQQPVALAAADLNNDGRLDLISVNSSDSTISLLIGNGDGTFQAQQVLTATGPNGSIVTYPTNPTALAVGDMNGDGNLDLIVTLPDDGPASDVDVFPGNGDGTFQATQITQVYGPLGSFGFNSMIVADFNRDGKLDVAAVGFGEENNQTLTILLGNGDGTFQAAEFPGEYDIGQPATSVASADFNGDGILDIALTNGSSGYTAPGQASYSIFIGNGDGTFQTPSTYELNPNLPSEIGGAPGSIQIADFNGDGKVDIAYAGPNYTMTNTPSNDLGFILLGNGDGTFQAPQSVQSAVIGGSLNLTVGDFNGDGRPDLISLTDADIPPAVLLDAGTSTSVSVKNVAIPPGIYPIAANYSGDSLYNSSTSTVTVDTRAPSPVTWADPAPITYNAALSSTQLDAASTIGGTFDYSPAAGTILNPGYYMLSVVFTPTDIKDYQPATLTVPLLVNQIPTTTTLTLSNQNLTLTATVNSSVPGSPTGDVLFIVGTTASAFVPLSSGGVASYTLASAPAPDDSILVQYDGDTIFAESSSSFTSIFTTTPSAASLTVAGTGTVTDTLTITPIPGYTGTLQLSCSGLPQNAACSLQPSSVTFSGTDNPTAVTLTIQTGLAPAAALNSPSHASPDYAPLIPAVILWIPGCFMGIAGTRSRLTRFRWQHLGIAILVLAAMSTLTSCGGGGNGSTQAPSPYATPAGTSAVQVSISAGSNMTETLTVNLTVH